MLVSEIIILEKDKEYISQFLKFFKAYMGDQLKIQGFTDKNICLKYVLNNKAAVLVTYDYCNETDFMEITKDRILIFSDEQDIETVNGMKAVYKYQKAENIVRCILDYCAEGQKTIRKTQSVKGGRSAKLIGVYSPVKRCGKTSFILEYAKKCGEDNKVLVISFEEYAPVCSVEKWKYDIEDLLYFYLQNGSGFELKLKAVIQRQESFDFIPPVKIADELRLISFEQWKDFLKLIQECGEYDCIILDVSDVIKNILKILDLCDFVIVPFVSDYNSIQKRSLFDTARKEYDWEEKIYPIAMDQVITMNFSQEKLIELVNDFYKGRLKGC